MAKNVKMVKCIKPCVGFKVGNDYKLIGQYSKYVEVEDELGNREIMLDIYFNCGSKNK